MKTKSLLGVAVVAIGATFATTAHAGVSFHVSLGLPFPFPCPPPPVVVYQPAPSYCPPPQTVVYQAPPPCPPPVVVHYERPVCAPVVYGVPAYPQYYQYRHGGWHHR